MLNRTVLWVTIACLVLTASPALSQKVRIDTDSIPWKGVLRQKPVWYSSDDAVRIADNILLYQRDTGGWPKNIDMAQPLTERERNELIKEQRELDSTIDNSATYTQLALLARVYSARKLERHEHGFLKGVEYLLRAQYDNGGWPQYYPHLTGYYKHITFNDGAMIGVMELLRDIAQKKPEYAFVNDDLRARAVQAVQKGIDLILKSQVVVDGKRTVWCAQHDEVTLRPAAARKFEPASLSGEECVDIVRFLMAIDHPDARVVEAIESAITWFEKTKISGIRWVERPDSARAEGFDHAVVSDATAGPLWARFYEIGTNRPIFSGRDGVIKYDVAEIEPERRNGYRWYVDDPVKLLREDYPAWKKRFLQNRER